MNKVLIVSKSDFEGGASLAAYRLCEGLRRIGFDSKMLVDYKMTNHSHIYGSTGNISRTWGKVRSFTDKLPLKLYDLETVDFHPAWIGKNIVKNEIVRNADVINLHWTAGGFISIKQITQLARLNKPIVWTLHDMWAFTGGCHYAGSCIKYKTECGSCPQLKSNKIRDISHKVFMQKSKHFSELNLEIVVLCNWMQNCVTESHLLSKKPLHLIPNSLDTDVFKPMKKSTVRNILNLPQDKKIILFGAIGATSNRRKGYIYLKKAMNSLAGAKDFHSEKICLAIFGVSYSKDIGDFPFEVKYLGKFHEECRLAFVYNAADVFVAPSLEDNLPNTILESLACGTPVVAFNVGGIPDMIEHRVSGFLCIPEEFDSLARGIQWVLEDNERAAQLGKVSRVKAIKKYSLNVQAQRYRDLFESLLKTH